MDHVIAIVVIKTKGIFYEAVEKIPMTCKVDYRKKFHGFKFYKPNDFCMKNS
jgi:hypothetical protein